MDLGPCGRDCSQIETKECFKSVCNTGQYAGQVDACIVVPAEKGTACDDGKFCTTGDACDGAGVCEGGAPNRCGIQRADCNDIVCFESSKSCTATPVGDGDACTADDLCEVNGVCQLGKCVGQPKDCSFSPLSECNTVGCDKKTGKCGGTPDSDKDDTLCFLSGDACQINKVCKTGKCQGGSPKDCSGLDSGCTVGSCESATGTCITADAAVGTTCFDGLDECQVGACDNKGDCSPKNAANGSSCNDHDACTTGDTCASGKCTAGSAVGGCSVYYREGFETCPADWTLAGDWQCGTPTNVGPAAAHTGKKCIATQIAANYHVNQSFSTTVATSPAIDLTAATTPVLSFWAWDHTEGSTFDGWNLMISTNGGTSFTEVSTVTPMYPLRLGSTPAWGGDHSADGWTHYSADLSAYKGHSVLLRFAFQSDAATVYPGVYIDDVVVAEPVEDPLYITTQSVDDVYVGVATTMPIAHVGGSPSLVWSKKSGGVNDDWLSVDASGNLVGTPTAANVGPVTVTVHVEEASLPSNFAEQTYVFKVVSDIYYSSFEGACPAGWTLTGDWMCGAPISGIGPGGAYVGSQCLGTKFAIDYDPDQDFPTSSATSPDIDLGVIANPKLTFRIFIDTEGSHYDGVQLEISTDSGATYQVVTSVTPNYNLMLDPDAAPAWGGKQGNLGWQLYQADLSTYARQTVRLRFGFRSDSSNDTPFAGIYIDDFFVN